MFGGPLLILCFYQFGMKLQASPLSSTT